MQLQLVASPPPPVKKAKVAPQRKGNVDKQTKTLAELSHESAAKLLKIKRTLEEIQIERKWKEIRREQRKSANAAAPKCSSAQLDANRRNIAPHNAARRDPANFGTDGLDLSNAHGIVTKLAMAKRMYDLANIILAISDDGTNREIVKFNNLTLLGEAFQIAKVKSKAYPTYVKKFLRNTYTHGTDADGKPSTLKKDRVYVTLSPKGKGYEHTEELWYSLYHPELTHERILSGDLPELFFT